MRLIPPITTNPVKIARNIPMVKLFKPVELLNAIAVVLACTILPIPKAAKAPNTAKHIPSHFIFSPSSR